MKSIRIPRILCHSLLILLGGLPSFSEILPPDRISDWSNVGVQGGIPDYPVGVNVKDAPYNAAGDGTTNDTTAILAAIAACPEGHAVYLPPGTYLTTGTLLITKPIVLRGASPEQTHVLHNHTSQGIRFNSGADWAGIEDLHLETVYPFGNASGTKVLLMGVTNSWVKNIETSGYAYSAVHLESTTHCEVRDSYVHSSYEYVDWEVEGGDMGDAYGIVIRGGTFSSYNLVENNVLDWHRHSMIMLVNCETNVYGYNFSWTNWSGKQSETQCFKLHHPDYDDETHSRVIRYTLSEGNVFESCDSHQWHYHNTHLRNRVMMGLGVNVRNSAVGNELTKKKFSWANDNTLNQTWQEGVFIHGNYITDRSEMQWDPTVDDHSIPNSYYLDSKPAFFGDLDWPCYGGDLMPGNKHRSPAEVRFWSMQFPEVAPTGLEASVDGGEVTLVWSDNSTNEVSFIVCRSTDNENFERIAIVAETTYTDTVSGDGDYFYYVRAMNHLGGVNGDEYGGESDPSNVVTILNTGTHPAPHPMPVISRGVPSFSSMGTASQANNSSYGDYLGMWSEQWPKYLAYDLSGVPEEQRSVVLLAWYNDSYPYFESVFRAPGDYTIEGNAADGGTLPAEGWVVLHTEEANIFHSRQHVVNMTGYNWIRLHVTSSEGSSQNLIFNMDIHDAHLGAEDSWIFFGDSITAGGMGQAERGGQNFAQIVNAANPAYFPSQENAGRGAWTTSNMVSTTEDRPVSYINQWLAIFPGRYVTLNFGTNDSGGLGLPDQTRVQLFYNNYETMVQAVLASGKIPVIPTIPWANDSRSAQNIPALNAQLEILKSQHPEIIDGPDFWTFFLEHPELLADALHPTDAGYIEYRRLWAEKMLDVVYSGSVVEPVNHPPVLEPVGNRSGQAGQTIQITIQAGDEDEDPLTYSASGTP